MIGTKNPATTAFLTAPYGRPARCPAGLTIGEVTRLALNAETAATFCDAVALYTIGDIDVTGFAPVIAIR